MTARRADLSVSPRSPIPPAGWLLLVLALGYAAVIAWTALGLLRREMSPDYLQRGWSTLLDSFTRGLPTEPPRSTDLQVNIMLYFPLGLLFGSLAVVLETDGRTHRRRWTWWTIGPGLSLAVEILQMMTPWRRPDIFDLLSNSAGYAAGFAFALALRQSLVLRRGHAREGNAWTLAIAAACAALFLLNLIDDWPRHSWGFRWDYALRRLPYLFMPEGLGNYLRPRPQASWRQLAATLGQVMPVGLTCAAACRLWLLRHPAWVQAAATSLLIFVLGVGMALTRSLSYLELHPTHALITCLLGMGAGAGLSFLLLIAMGDAPPRRAQRAVPVRVEGRSNRPSGQR